MNNFGNTEKVNFLKGIYPLLILVHLLFSVSEVESVEPDEILDNQLLELRARDLSKELRCLVCRNESIDESNSIIAKDLRILVRERLIKGDTDKEVLNFLVTRYGEFILLNPRIDKKNIFLWSIGPTMFLLSVIILYLVFFRSSRSSS